MIQGQWKSDGSEADGKGTWSATSSLDGSDIEMNNTSSGSPMNFMYDMSPKSTFYFQVTLTEISTPSSSLSVGVVRPEEFHKGYRINGMFYNGNLTNGNAALKTSYGSRLKTPGDVLLVEYVESNEHRQTIQVILYLNGNCLGTGFEIPKTDTSFVPCISAHGELKFQTKVLLGKPELTSSPPPHPLSGKWIVIDASDGNGKQLLPVPDTGKKTILSIENQEADMFNIAIRVCNTLSIRKRISEGASSSGRHFLLESVGEGHVNSTRMRAPSPFHEVEAALPACMKLSWLQMEIVKDDGDRMYIQAGPDEPVVTCEREVPSMEAACTSYKD
jgi:hypothetical protein